MDLEFFTRGVKKTHLKVRLQTLTAAQRAIEYLEAKGQFSDRAKYPWPDLIVVDLKMPQLNGFDFLAWRKSSPLFSSIPVVVFSGTTEPAVVRKIFDLGANKHIVKPNVRGDWGTEVARVSGFDRQGA